MKVLVIGAHGKVGQRVMKAMQADNRYEPVAFVRKQEQVDEYKDLGMNGRLGNLFGTVDEIKETMDGVDAVVFSAGAGGSSDANTILVDLDGAVKTMEAAEQLGIHRFIMVSAYGAGERERWSKSIIPYYATKMYADRELMRTDLDYTILRPGHLGDDEGTGKIQLVTSETGEPDDYTTQRDDVCETILTVLPKKSTYRQVYEFVSGETPITDVFE
ncbi:MAG: SDR family oxidoreductase [Aerococcus sp.]|nr:SDR family oxidoreductase [Aerococcus sp.]